CPGGCAASPSGLHVVGFVVDLLRRRLVQIVGCPAPALTTRPLGVAVRPTLQCGEHGPTRLPELRSGWLSLQTGVTCSSWSAVRTGLCAAHDAGAAGRFTR